MSNALMTCLEERQLGSTLAQNLGFVNTQSSFHDSDQDPKTILQTALLESQGKGGFDVVIENALQGPAWWAYILLRFGPELGDKRDAFLSKAAQSPKSAYYTLKFVPNLDSHREELMAGVRKDAGWAALLNTDTPKAEAPVLAAVDAPPVEEGWGYNTYFVNQCGVDIWVSYNTGEVNSDGSITGPNKVKAGQNIGFGRGGTVLTEVRVWRFNPDPNNNQPAHGWHIGGFLGLWSLPQGANGAKSWGFRIDNTGIVQSEDWYSGGMPVQYPPSNGN